MNRSIKKGPFADEYLLKKVIAQENTEKERIIRTWSRRSIIFPSSVGLAIAACDGRRHVPVYVTGDTVGHRLGEFVPTRTLRGHKADDKATK